MKMQCAIVGAAMLALTGSVLADGFIGLNDFSGGETVIDFNTTDMGTLGDPTADIGSGVFVTNAGGGTGGPGWRGNTDWGTFFDNIPGSSQGRALADSWGASDLLFDFTGAGSPTRAGMLLSTGTRTDYDIVVYDPSGNVIDSGVASMPNNSEAVFVGYEASGGVGFIRVSDVENGQIGIVDDVRFESLNFGSGTLYAVRESDDVLVKIDLSTLTISDVGPLNTAFAFGGMAYDPNACTMYITPGRGNESLYTVDLGTGNASLVGAHNVIDMFGLAFDTSTNTLYATQFSQGTGFYQMNTSNGSASLIGTMSNGIGGLAYEPNSNRLIGVQDGAGDLYEINRANGAQTLIFDGPSNNDSGLAYDADNNFLWDIDWNGNLYYYDIGNGFARTTVLTGLTAHDGLEWVGAPDADVVLDFQALEVNNNGVNSVGNLVTEDGFEVTDSGARYAVFGTQESRYPGSTALFNDVVNGVIRIRAVNGESFNVKSIDFAMLNGSGSVAINLVGNKTGGGQVFQTINHSDGGLPLDLVRYCLDDFTNLDSIEWLQESPFHQFDNVAIDFAPSGFTLDVTGTCPGLVTVNWSGAQPNATVALIFAKNTGSFVIPFGPCQGTVLGLGNRSIRLVNTFPSGLNGSGSRTGNAGGASCGGFLQMHDIPNCDLSNVAQLP